MQFLTPCFFYFQIKPFVVTCLWAGASCCCDVKSPRAETDADGLLPEFQKWCLRLKVRLFCFYINPQAILHSCIVKYSDSFPQMLNSYACFKVDWVISLGWYFSLNDISQMSLTVIGFMWADFIMLQEREQEIEWVGRTSV